MRTKALLLTAAISAAGLASSLAQIYSVNVVGYAQVTIKAGGFQLIANPLSAPTNTIASLFSGVTVPNGTVVYKFSNTAGYSQSSYFFGWSDPAGGPMTLSPGEGAFINLPGSTDLTVTFVGDVVQGSLTNDLPAGFSIKSSQVPVSGKLATDLLFPAANSDVIFKYNVTTKGYDQYSYFFGWSPSEPTLNIGEAAFVNKAAAGSWNRTFTVSP